MSRYTPVTSSPSSPTTPTRRSSFVSLRRPSFSSFRLGSGTRSGPIPDPDEMDAAFDGPEDEGESHGLLGARDGHVPGDYDFERDYTLPPPSPPPFQPYSSHNPAPGNTNGLVPSSPPFRPTPARHLLGGILPTSLLPRAQSAPGSRVIGAGQTGVFANLSARPDNGASPEVRADHPDYVPEIEQKDGPPSYQMALRDAVPTYWDTTVVLPSSNSPFGPLSSSISGDEVLIDGMPSGNFFGFFWNLIVSVSFQFVGFLLTYVLHTTHAAKYGSRVGLGITLIQFGLNIRSKAEELLSSGEWPTDPSDPTPTDPNANADEAAADNALKAFWGPGTPWPQSIKDPLLGPEEPPVILHSSHEAELYAQRHNTTLSKMLDLPSAMDVGRANEYFSFILMSLGWFLVLTSVGGWWRVKRFERGLRNAQREGELAQAAANRGDADAPITTETTSNVTVNDPGRMTMDYYTSAFSQAWRGARDIRRGFLGMNGRPSRGQGHTPLPTDEHELLDAQGFGLEPMANDEAARRARGLWGV